MMDGKKLNRMCVDCNLYKQKECNGTFESVWTGCVYRKSGVDYQNQVTPIRSREDIEETRKHNLHEYKMWLIGLKQGRLTTAHR